MLAWLGKLFGDHQPKTNFRQVDWFNVDARWRSLEAMASGQDQAARKQALIQADMLVDSILKQAQVPGATMGERLKYMKGRIDHLAYRMLWQAHLKRNELVHDEGSFVADWEVKQHLENFSFGIAALRRVR